MSVLVILLIGTAFTNTLYFIIKVFYKLDNVKVFINTVEHLTVLVFLSD